MSALNAVTISTQGGTALRLLRGALFVMALTGFVLAVPAMYGGAAVGLSGSLREKLYDREKMSEKEMDRFLTLRIQSLDFWDNWQGYDDIAQGLMARAIDRGLLKKEGRDLLPEILRFEKEALMRNPSNGYAWARLAFTRLLYTGPSELVIAPLWQSIQTAPYEPDMLPSRITLMLRMKEFWTPEMAEAFPRQVELAFLRQAEETVKAVEADGLTEELRAEIKDKPDLLVQYAKALAHIHGFIEPQAESLTP